MPRTPIPVGRRLLGKVTVVTEAHLWSSDVKERLAPHIRADRLNERVSRVTRFRIEEWRRAGLTWAQIGAFLDAGFTSAEIARHVQGRAVIKDRDVAFLRALS